MTPVYVVASKLIGQRTQMDMIADNVANVNTSGYKKLGISFEEIVSRQNSTTVGSFTQDRGISTDHSSGGLTKTNNTLDVALQGKGFFAVEVNGQVQYSRNGQFNLDSEGNLVNAKGFPILDNNNAPISIPADSTNIVITKNGSISDENGIIASIGVFEFNNPQRLLRAGAGAWSPNNEQAITIESPTVLQGMLEDSNVNAIQETVQMTTLARTYQSASKLMKDLEDVESKAIRNIASMPQ